MAKAKKSAGTKKGVKKTAKEAVKKAVKKAAKKAVKKVVKKAAAKPVKKSKKKIVVHSSVKKALLKRREQIAKSLLKLTGSATESSSKPVGDHVDDAVLGFEIASTYAIAEQEAEELRLIDLAFEKIDEGSYGFCEVCEEPIEEMRVKALPYATLCLKCKEEEELEASRFQD